MAVTVKLIDEYDDVLEFEVMRHPETGWRVYATSIEGGIISCAPADLLRVAAAIETATLTGEDVTLHVTPL